MEPEVAGVLSQFKSIKKHASLLRQFIIRRGLADDEGLKSLVEEFKDAKAHFERIRYERKIGIISLRSIKMPRDMWVGEQKALLSEIDIECDKAIGVLGNIATALSKDELDKLSSLVEELEKLSEVLPDINYERNLSEAIDEYEKGDYLASALISRRVIIYALNQIPGQSDEEKVKFLREKGIIAKDRKDVHESIIKASRRARNFFSHDIKVFPTPSEALSLLGDAIGILEKASKVLRREEKS
ncbi:MAG TPA: hypothetical protein ENI51_09405 [Candidatus Atribacteria bacterium]|nr:hypothetical protein [Candidatus Atribacteria bacterium]